MPEAIQVEENLELGKNAKRGTRPSEETKAAVVEFLMQNTDVDNKVKQGAFSRAQSRFGVSYLTARKLLMAANPDAIIRERRKKEVEA